MDKIGEIRKINSFILLYLKDDPLPSQNLESSLEESAPGEVIAEFQPVSFQIVESGTKRRKTSLIDSLGFCYNVHSRRPYATYWQCTVRPKGNPCKASVTERDGVFRPGQQSHNHTVEMGAATAAKIVSQVKSKALDDKFKPASAIVDEVTIYFLFKRIVSKEDDSYLFLRNFLDEKNKTQLILVTSKNLFAHKRHHYVSSACFNRFFSRR